MIDYTLNIGELAIDSRNVSYTCYGLGSCIGLFIQDRSTGLSAGAHIFLPEEDYTLSADGKFYSVSSALTEIKNRLRRKGSDLNSLRAKVAGGANVHNLNSDTGERNILSVIKCLTENRIFIAALDVGGSFCRTVRFESKTGVLTIRKSEINRIENF